MNLSELNLEALANLTFPCACGETHSADTKRFAAGRDALKSLDGFVESTGAKDLLFISAEDVYNRYGRSVELLLRTHYRVNVHIFPANFVPTILRVAELAKFSGAEAVVCFGSGSVADVSKYHCSVKGIPLIAVLTSPCADLSSFSNLMLNGKSERMLAASPYAVIADSELVKTAPPSMVASAFGWLTGAALALFEWKFAYLIGREPYCATLAKFSEQLIECALSAGERWVVDGEGLEDLTETLLRHAVCVQFLGKGRIAESSASLTAAVLQALNEPKGQGSLLGERVMLAANRLVRLCKVVFSEDVVMPVLPTDKQKRARLLSDVCGTNAGETLSRLFDQPRINVEIARHKIHEYRPELMAELEKLESLILRANRVFRRCYPDGGFWLGQAEVPNFRTAVYLAPDLSDTFTTLTLMRDMGLLEYIA